MKEIVGSDKAKVNAKLYDDVKVGAAGVRLSDGEIFVDKSYQATLMIS